MKTESLYQGLYEIGQQVVEQENPAYLVVAVDPVNFEKPYAQSDRRREHGSQGYAARVGWEGSPGAWLSGYHGDGGQHASTR